MRQAIGADPFVLSDKITWAHAPPGRITCVGAVCVKKQER